MESYQRLIDVIAIENLQMRLEHWLLTQVLVWSTLGQAAAILAALGLAYILARPIRARLAAPSPARQASTRRRPRPRGGGLVDRAPVLARCSSSSAPTPSRRELGWPSALLITAINLIGAWIVIRLITRLIRNDFWSRVVAFLAFAIATLNILGLLGPTIVWLDQIGFRLGDTRVSALDILRAAGELVLLLWLAVFVSRLLEARVQRAPSLTPSLRVLTSKLIRFSLIAPRARRRADQHRHRPHRLRALHRRARRRHRLRAAEADLQPDQRPDPALRPLDQARRRGRADRSRPTTPSSSSAG